MHLSSTPLVSNVQVFATDLFVSKFQNDILSQSVGLQFRNKVRLFFFNLVHELNKELGLVLHGSECNHFPKEIVKFISRYGYSFIRLPSIDIHKAFHATPLQVYAPGGSKDAINILADFLGREPSVRTFIENKIKNSLYS